MTVAELILYSSREVRSNPDLFREYIRLYTEEKGKKPNCASCSFNGVYERWVKEHSEPIKISRNMANTFKLIPSKKYIVVPFSNGQVINADADDSLVAMYLDQVKGDARKNRESNFTKLPDAPKKEAPKSEEPEAPQPKKKGRKKKVTDGKG